MAFQQRTKNRVMNKPKNRGVKIDQRVFVPELKILYPQVIQGGYNNKVIAIKNSVQFLETVIISECAKAPV